MQAVKVASKPLLLSHTAVSVSPAMGPTPLQGRQISPDHARAIADTGGSVGTWHFLPSLDKYVDLKEMRLGDLIRCGTPARSVWIISGSRPPLLTHARRERLQEEVRFAPDSPLEGDGFEPSVPREGPTRRDGFIRLSSGGSEARHRRSAISTARSGPRSPPGP
jgi:hypothetical protein